MLKSWVTGMLLLWHFNSLQFEDAKEEPEREGGQDAEDDVDGTDEAGVVGDHEHDAAAAGTVALGVRD